MIAVLIKGARMRLQETYEMLQKFESCQTEEQVSIVALDAASEFGAEYYLSGTMPPPISSPENQMKHLIIGSWPKEWSERYFSCKYLQDDPTITHVRKNIAPLIWDDLNQIDSSRNFVMDEARDFGLLHGITIPQQSLDGLKIGISFAGRHMETSNPNSSIALTVIGAYAVSSALRVLKHKRRNRQVNLTKREREILYWIAEGKTSWEIGIILSIAKPTVEKHFTALQHKLKVNNRTHAVAEALRCGLLH